VEDFLTNDFGKAIVTNASIKFLMKQSPASVPVLSETFYLSEGEKQLLVSADVGEGIFFAGQNHVALRVVASPEEHAVITTNPEELVKRNAPAAAPAPAKRTISIAMSPLSPLSGFNQNAPGVKPVQEAAATQQPSTAAANVPLSPKLSQPSPQKAETSPVEIQQSRSANNPEIPTPTPPPSEPDPNKPYLGHFTIDDYQPPTNGSLPGQK
jgi:hypothetical protein